MASNLLLLFYHRQSNYDFKLQDMPALLISPNSPALNKGDKNPSRELLSVVAQELDSNDSLQG